jgi:hypothetical protein
MTFVANEIISRHVVSRNTDAHQVVLAVYAVDEPPVLLVTQHPLDFRPSRLLHKCHDIEPTVALARGADDARRPPATQRRVPSAHIPHAFAYAVSIRYKGICVLLCVSYGKARHNAMLCLSILRRFFRPALRSENAPRIVLLVYVRLMVFTLLSGI